MDEFTPAELLHALACMTSENLALRSMLRQADKTTYTFDERMAVADVMLSHNAAGHLVMRVNE